MKSIVEDVVAETRRLLADGDYAQAVAYSGEEFAKLHGRWAAAGSDVDAAAPLMLDMLLVADNHLRVLFTGRLFTEIFSTAMVTMGRTLMTDLPDAESLRPTVLRIQSARMLIVADALTALMNYVEMDPPKPSSPEAQHLSALLAETASMLYNYYNKVKSDSPDDPELPEIYALLNQLMPLGAIRTAVVINNTEVPTSDTNAMIGDMLGRVLALGWLTD